MTAMPDPTPARENNVDRLPSTCPSCGTVAQREPYDIGSGPEYSCADCELCWGALGQPLKPLPVTGADLPGYVGTLYMSAEQVNP